MAKTKGFTEGTGNDSAPVMIGLTRSSKGSELREGVWNKRLRPIEADLVGGLLPPEP